MGRSSRGKKSPKGGKKSPKKGDKSESEGSQDDWDVDLDDAELTIGYEKAGFGIEFKIGETVELTLGIGVASVTIDLMEPNNSSISFAFGIYEIVGKRDGCTVKLEYYILGQLAKEETRIIPECEEDNPPDEDIREEPDEEGDIEEPEEQPPIPPYLVCWGFIEIFTNMSYTINFPGGEVGNIVNITKAKVGRTKANKSLKNTSFWDFAVKSSFGRNSKINPVVTKIEKFAMPGQYYQYGQELSPEEFAEWNNCGPYASYIFEDNGKVFMVPRHIADNNSEDYGEQIFLLSGYLASVADRDLGSRVIIVSGASATYFNDAVAALNRVNRTGWVGRDGFVQRASAKIMYSELYKPPEKNVGPAPPRPKKKRNEMDEKCCKMIAQIWEVLRAEDLLKDGYPIPKKLIAPGGKGYDKPKDYPAILKRLIQILDKGLISDFTAILEDADLSTPGNQPQTKSYPDATASMQEVVQFLMRNKVDDATVQDILIRQTILQAEIMEALMETQSIVKTLLIGLGIPYKNAVGSFNMPVDVDVDEDKAAEKNLPQFLQESTKNYEAVDPDLSSDTLWFYVTMMYLKGKR